MEARSWWLATTKTTRISTWMATLMKILPWLLLLALCLCLLFLEGCSPRRAAPPSSSTPPAERVIEAPSLSNKSALPVEEALKIVKQFPKSPSAHFELGRAYYLHKQFKNAIPSFKKVLELDPLYEDAYYGLANSYAYSSPPNWEEAKKAWRRLTELPSATQKDRVDGYIGLGNNALRQHRFSSEKQFLAEAEGAYQKAAQIDPENSGAWDGLGIVSARRQQWSEARERFEKAVKYADSPRHKAKALERLANVWLELGDRRKAERLLEEAKQTDPSYPAVFFRRE